MKKNQKKISFQKQRIAMLSNTALLKIAGGSKTISDPDPTKTSRFYSDGPPRTTLGLSG